MLNQRISPAVKWLLLINVGASLPTLIGGAGINYFNLLALRPVEAIKSLQIWQVVTYGFLHAGVMHLAFNMLALFMFAPEVEEKLGTRRFLILYLGAQVFSGLVSIPFFWYGTVVGASGALFGVLFVFAKLFPYRQILLFFIFPVSATMAVWIIGAISLIAAISSPSGNIAHLTHLGGLLAGFIFWKYKDSVTRHLEKREYEKFEKKKEAYVRNQLEKQDYYKKRIDPILKKISEKGIHSLTEKEKADLKKSKDYEK